MFGPMVSPLAVLKDDPSIATAYPDARDRDGLRKMAKYITVFLTRNQPNLGRRGPVCPFAGPAVAKRSLHIASCSDEMIDEQELLAAIDVVREEFIAGATPDENGQVDRLRSCAIVFPSLPADSGAALIERVQMQMKRSFVIHGLMIGEFYPECDASGLHNPEFKPLQAPVISLAMRYMTEFDGVFMMDDPVCKAAFEKHFPSSGVFPPKGADTAATPGTGDTLAA